MNEIPLRAVSDYTRISTEVIVDSLSTIKDLEIFVQSVCHSVDDERRDQLRKIVIEFQETTQRAINTGIILTNFGQYLRKENLNRELIVKTLNDLTTQLYDIEKQINDLNDDMCKARKDIDDDLFKANVIMGVAITTAVVGVVILLAVATFGIGAAVSCPILCALLASMGLTNSGLLIGTGTVLGITGVILLSFGTSRAHSARMSKKDLEEMHHVLQQLSKEISGVRKKVSESKSLVFNVTNKVVEFELEFKDLATSFEEAGKNLTESATKALETLYDIEQHIISTPRSSCVLL